MSYEALPVAYANCDFLLVYGTFGLSPGETKKSKIRFITIDKETSYDIEDNYWGMNHGPYPSFTALRRINIMVDDSIPPHYEKAVEELREFFVKPDLKVEFVEGLEVDESSDGDESVI